MNIERDLAGERDQAGERHLAGERGLLIMLGVRCCGLMGDERRLLLRRRCWCARRPGCACCLGGVRRLVGGVRSLVSGDRERGLIEEGKRLRSSLDDERFIERALASGGDLCLMGDWPSRWLASRNLFVGPLDEAAPPGVGARGLVLLSAPAG